MLSLVFTDRIEIPSSTWNQELDIGWLIQHMNSVSSNYLRGPTANESYRNWLNNNIGSTDSVKLMYGEANAAAICEFMFSLGSIFGKQKIKDVSEDKSLFADYFSLIRYEWLTHANHFSLNAFYRDHLLHPVYVTALGCFLLKEFRLDNGSILLDQVATLIEHEVTQGSLKMFLTNSKLMSQLGINRRELNSFNNEDAIIVAKTAWELSGLYHDIGYYLENLREVYFNKCKAFNILPSAMRFPPDDLPLQSQNRYSRMVTMSKYISKYGEYLFKCSNSFDLNKLTRLVSAGNVDEICRSYFHKSHAFWSTTEILHALNSLHQSEDTRLKLAMIIAASAIAKHHVVPNEFNPPLSFQSEPIFFMLRLLDEVQENSRISLGLKQDPRRSSFSLSPQETLDRLTISENTSPSGAKELCFTLHARNQWWLCNAAQERKNKMEATLSRLFGEADTTGFAPVRFNIDDSSLTPPS